MSQKIKITIIFIYIVHIVAAIESECGIPDSIENGSFLKTDDKVKYTCYPGYQIVGRPVVYCTARGWDHPAPKCKPRSCGNPGEILNGYYVAPSALFGSSVTFFCDNGYRLIGTPSRICQASGWSGQVPICEVVTCEDLEPIENGRTPTASNKEFWENGMVAKFSCTGDYALIGAEELVCTETGRWDKAPPTCKVVQCIRPKLSEGTDIVAGFGPTYKYRETITYRCQHGYEMVGANIIECTAINEFLPSPPSCNLTGCKRPGDIDNGRMERERETYALYEEIKYQCNYGYKLNGSSSIRCKENHMFVPKPPTCKQIICEAPNSIQNGRKVRYLRYGTPYTFGQKVTYQCNYGFKPFGERISRCNENGIFVPPIPTCQRVICEAPEHIENGQITPSAPTYYYQNRVTVKCNRGFKPFDDRTSVCRANGNFEPRISTCQRVICEAPKHIENGQITPSAPTYYYEDRVTVKCNRGFKPFDDKTSVCKANGNFEPPISTCQKENPIAKLNQMVSLLCHIITTKMNSIKTERDLLRLEEESLQHFKNLQQKVEAILRHWKISIS
ncbi:C4b-binding protein alpha chain-like isoform X2 [Mustelus asterias]